MILISHTIFCTFFHTFYQAFNYALLTMNLIEFDRRWILFINIFQETTFSSGGFFLDVIIIALIVCYMFYLQVTLLQIITLTLPDKINCYRDVCVL